MCVCVRAVPAGAAAPGRPGLHPQHGLFALPGRQVRGGLQDVHLGPAADGISTMYVAAALGSFLSVNAQAPVFTSCPSSLPSASVVLQHRPVPLQPEELQPGGQVHRGDHRAGHQGASRCRSALSLAAPFRPGRSAT